MKKLIMTILVAIVTTGCNVEISEKMPARRFHFQGHTYINFYTYGLDEIVHDPDCQCSKKKTMEKMIVVHKNSGADICIMVCLDKETGKYRFVNLTKRHICICQFDTIEDAMEDLDRYVKEGKIKGYTAC